MTKVIKDNDFEAIVKMIKEDMVVAFPTETVYGVGVRYGSIRALNKLMEAKKRDYSKAITLMVANKADIEQFAYVSAEARKLIEAFMPGMITLVFKKKATVDPIMTNGKDTIGIRIPDSQFVLSLLLKVGPMLVTSANLSNHPNATCTQEVLEQLKGRIDAVVEGKTSDNMASTVIDVTGHKIKILREGKMTKEAIEEVLKS